MPTKKPAWQLAMRIFRCFNVAAICALGVWHGYAFYVHQARQKPPQTPAIELHRFVQAGQPTLVLLTTVSKTQTISTI
ncbi:hypothetical protein BH11PSE12_BH11PSE12_23950 [soil metagenome]